jgi:hypothetical protein
MDALPPSSAHACCVLLAGWPSLALSCPCQLPWKSRLLSWKSGAFAPSPRQCCPISLSLCLELLVSQLWVQEAGTSSPEAVSLLSEARV